MSSYFVAQIRIHDRGQYEKYRRLAEIRRAGSTADILLVPGRD